VTWLPVVACVYVDICGTWCCLLSSCAVCIHHTVAQQMLHFQQCLVAREASSRPGTCTAAGSAHTSSTSSYADSCHDPWPLCRC
jgi:hypothetical protein